MRTARRQPEAVDREPAGGLPGDQAHGQQGHPDLRRRRGADRHERGAADGDWPGPGQWYLYLGGPIGATFVGVAAVVVRRTGVLRLGLAVVAGQVVGALALDLAVPVTSTGIATTTVVSAALTLVAVAVSGLGVRRA